VGSVGRVELTRGNHFKFGYDEEWFVDRKRPEDVWTVAYGRCTRPVLDWRAECIATARLIRESTNLDLWVLYSGGIDSEVVLQAFKFAGIPINAAITCFENDLNRHDVRLAVKFCETHAIPYKLLRLDIEKFVASGDAMAYAERTRCTHPCFPRTMWAMDQVDGYPILGSGECYLVKTNAEGVPSSWLEEDCARITTPPLPPATWALSEKEQVAAWHRHLQVNNRSGCPGFFQYTPEVMVAFLRDPMVAQLCANQLAEHTDTMAIKAVVYRQHFLLERRPKYTSLENVAALERDLGSALKKRWSTHDARFLTPYAKLLAGMDYEP
jgi:hypothetical protein